MQCLCGGVVCGVCCFICGVWRVVVYGVLVVWWCDGLAVWCDGGVCCSDGVVCGVSYVLCGGVWCNDWWCHGLVVWSGGIVVPIPNMNS